MKNSTKSALFMALLSVTACKRDALIKPGADAPAVPSSSGSFAAAKPGSAVFTRFISVGDSQTAGFADNGLYNEGIEASFPNILASKLKDVGLASFNQPLFGAGSENGTGYVKFQSFVDGLPVVTPVATNLGIRGSFTVKGATYILYQKYTGLLDNYGVPGLKVADVSNPLYGNYNGYLERMMGAIAPRVNTKYTDFVTSQPYTFFTLNLGSNDALGYALNGGANFNDLTTQGTFAAGYTTIVNKLVANGAKGVLTTIPEIKNAAFFHTITPSLLSGMGGGVPIYISARKNMDGNSSSYGVRVATDDDLILLTFDVSKLGQPVRWAHGVVPYGESPLAPIENNYVMDVKEAQLASIAINGYNTTIRSLAASNSLALFDAANYINAIKGGVVLQGFQLNARFFGGLFSLDGAHLSPRGNAVVANQYIIAINKTYGATLKTVDLSLHKDDSVAIPL